MGVLEKIVADKRREVAKRKSEMPESLLRNMPYAVRNTVSLREAIRSKKGRAVIAEFKRRSPSRPEINSKADVVTVCSGYVQSGAVGVSVLTDEKYFGGSLQDLLSVRERVQVPLLRKDFIIDHYQLLESKAYGADAVLLIAAILTPEQIDELTRQAHELGLEVLLEVHSREEWERCKFIAADVVGVNNRNLDTLEVCTHTSVKLAKVFSSDIVRISESGIEDVETAIELADTGYSGFLIGEYFMKQENPVQAAGDFIDALNHCRHEVKN